MSQPVDIVVCPLELRAEAIALVLGDLAPSQRREIGRDVVRTRREDDASARAFFVALRNGQLRGAAWGQFQPGNTAVLWPAKLDVGENISPTAERLTAAAIGALDAAGVAMTQVLLPAQDSPDALPLQTAGFRYLTDLVYLTCERDRFATSPESAAPLEFEPYEFTQRGRLTALAQQTYQETLDCAALGDERDIEDVVDGYLATGKFDPHNWFFVRAALGPPGDVNDIGLLLLTEHPASIHIELIYMGLVPAARGRGWGRAVVEQAQRIARHSNADRIVCAVDAQNLPALAVYRDTHFEVWDRRSVFLRFLPRT
jgi:mycothiol synthase